MNIITCPVCGHKCNGRIQFGSHIRRCREINDRRDFKPNKKLNSKRKLKKRARPPHEGDTNN